ncbi:hypothetical protein RvY_19182 [Ramazzottius varieornatus]|uniref:BTB domain-containing protein n=1 Tax=Ramazzottius varieornatus TaxID=947166 RepID=A0A1D1W9T9_RAMVA|nr:hypothetical protein RvY_19182 [Ramazzottius varieornatus]
MLIPNSKEAASGRCVLPDMNSKMVEVLLLFVYGGLKTVPEELAQPLLIAADKEAGGMEKLRAEGNAELLTMVEDMGEPKPSS